MLIFPPSCQKQVLEVGTKGKQWEFIQIILKIAVHRGPWDKIRSPAFPKNTDMHSPSKIPSATDMRQSPNYWRELWSRAPVDATRRRGVTCDSVQESSQSPTCWASSLLACHLAPLTALPHVSSIHPSSCSHAHASSLNFEKQRNWAHTSRGLVQQQQDVLQFMVDGFGPSDEGHSNLS